ncbi:early transcribed membrane protein, partial [Plasmodium cynomolgi strain B]
MKLAKLFYFVAFLITIKVFVPGLNNDGLVQAKSASADSKSLKKLDNDMLKKQRNQKIMIISTIATSLAILLGGALGGYSYYKQKKTKKPNTPIITNRPMGKGETRNLSRSQEDISKIPPSSGPSKNY